MTMSNSLEEIKAEVDKRTDSRNLEASIRFQRNALMTFVTGLEMVNDKFGHRLPVKPRLKGWSESVHTNVEDFDEIFEELYAMRLYDDHLGCNNYCRKHWRTFAINILEFLEDLHDIGYVHMDIKKGNILVDYKTNTCVVADYEHAVPPNQKRTEDYPADAAWYYIAMGAEMDKPLFSWRMDLAALAFIISDLSAPVCRPNIFEHRTFELECYNRRSKDGLSLEDILTLRAADIAAAHPDVQEYWRRLDEVSWYAPEPPRKFYKEMRDLLAGS